MVATTRFASLSKLLRPLSVAVVGASADPLRIGGRPIAYMLAQGYAGRILPVNPGRGEVQGLPTFPSVAALPEVPDAAIVAVGAGAAMQAVRDLAAIGAGGAIVLTSGFAETGPAGAAAQAEMAAAAHAGGMRLLGPNCLGLFNAGTAFYATFSASFESGWPLPGRIGIASQSGAYGSHLAAVARARGLGTPICVTTGNEADVTVADVIGWLAEDPDIDVIAAYVEGIRDGDAFVAALAAARAARKPVVVMKVGASALGGRAALSHTAAIAGDDAVCDAVLAEFGAVRAGSTEHMLDVAYLATRRLFPAGNALGVLTISGGAGVMISDAAAAHGLAMPPMPEAAQAALCALVPFAAPANPVDCTGQVFNDVPLVGRFGAALAEAGLYRAVLAFFTQVGGAPSMVPRLRAALRPLAARHPDLLWVLSVLAPPEAVRDYEADGFAVFEDPTRAVAAIAAMGVFGAAFADLTAAAVVPGLAPPNLSAPNLPPPSQPDLPSPSLLPPTLLPIGLPAAAPDEAEAKALLVRAGIAVVPERIAATADQAVRAAEMLGYPVVLKILSPDIPHKTEIGGVLLNLADAGAVRVGFATLKARAVAACPDARLRGVLVASLVPDGVECLMGVVRDPVFGLVAAFGLGGVFAEVLDDVALHRCPFGADVAEAMIRSVRGAKLLLGARGRPPADIATLAGMLARLSVFAHQAGGRLRSIDLNPVFARSDGALVADVLIDIDADG